jgi:Zn-dependent protease
MNGFDFAALARDISVWALPMLTAIPLHEAAHGFAALRFGDDTARRMGRISANPLRHVDPFGTIVLPAMLLLLSGGRIMFGYAKPVPVNFSKLKPLRLGMVLVAAAGPATNLLLAYVSALLMHVAPWLPREAGRWAAETLWNSILLNLVLAVFNMLPLPPLDGGRVAVGLLPRPLGVRYGRIERYGMLILLAALFLLPAVGQSLGINLDLFSLVIWPPVQWLGNLVVNAAGLH